MLYNLRVPPRTSQHLCREHEHALGVREQDTSATSVIGQVQDPPNHRKPANFALSRGILLLTVKLLKPQMSHVSYVILQGTQHVIVQL